MLYYLLYHDFDIMARKRHLSRSKLLILIVCNFVHRSEAQHHKAHTFQIFTTVPSAGHIPFLKILLGFRQSALLGPRQAQQGTLSKAQQDCLRRSKLP